MHFFKDSQTKMGIKH